MLHDSERSIASLGLFFECMESLGGPIRGMMLLLLPCREGFSLTPTWGKEENRQSRSREKKTEILFSVTRDTRWIDKPNLGSRTCLTEDDCVPGCTSRCLYSLLPNLPHLTSHSLFLSLYPLFILPFAKDCCLLITTHFRFVLAVNFSLFPRHFCFHVPTCHLVHVCRQETPSWLNRSGDCWRGLQQQALIKYALQCMQNCR